MDRNTDLDCVFIQHQRQISRRIGFGAAANDAVIEQGCQTGFGISNIHGSRFDEQGQVDNWQFPVRQIEHFSPGNLHGLRLRVFNFLRFTLKRQGMLPIVRGGIVG